MPVFRDAFWKLQASPYRMEMLLLAVKGLRQRCWSCRPRFASAGRGKSRSPKPQQRLRAYLLNLKMLRSPREAFPCCRQRAYRLMRLCWRGRCSAVWVSCAGAGVFGGCCSLFAGAVCALGWFVGISAEAVSAVPPHPMRLIVQQYGCACYKFCVFHFELPPFFDRDRLLSSRLS